MDRGRTVAALLALAACIACSTAAPMASNQTALELLEGPKDGCYYNFQHYGENDRIMTNEPCLNCTCHNRMLMCYLRVCPFTKAIGQDCTIEKRADQCCPIVTCPDVPVDLLTSTSTSSPAEYGATGLGKLDKYGCSINNKYFSEGAKVPSSPNKPCEHCYCIRNMTTCVMQECTLHVDGCTPIYRKDVCCPVRYSCDHPEDATLFLDDMTTTVRPTPGFLLTTTTILPVTQATQDCIHADQIFSDGALIKTEKACEHCYCMKGDIVCVVQECGTPMENEGKNCTSLPPRHGQCCPDTYICEGDEPGSDLSTEIPEVTTSPPRRGGVEGSGYRNEPDESNAEVIPFDSTTEGSGEENVDTDTAETPVPEKVTSGIFELILTTTETSKIDQSTEPIKEQNTIAVVEEYDISNKEEMTTQTTEIKPDDIKTSHDDKSTTIVSEYPTSSPAVSTVSLGDYSVITESLDKTNENTEMVYQKTTTQDLIDKTTPKQEYLDENNLVTPKSTEITEENIAIDDTKTTHGLELDTTKQEHFDNNYYITTEPVEKIEDSFIVDNKKTTMHDFVDEITPKQEDYDTDLTVTETVQKDDENVIFDGKKTTTKDYDSFITKQEKLDNDLGTTESIYKLDENIDKKTTMKDYVEESTNQEYNEQVTESVEKANEDVNSDITKTTLQDLTYETTKSHLNENISATTESLEETDEHIISDDKTTTIKDFIYETTHQGHFIDDNGSISTESIENADENMIGDVEKTTKKDYVYETTKQEDLNKDNALATTESVERVDDIMTDSKKTTVQDFSEETTLKQEHPVTKIEDMINLEHKTSTQVPEHILITEHTITNKEFTTFKSDKSETTEINMHENERVTEAFEKTDAYTTIRENIYDDNTTPINLIENEIVENITPTLLPSRIPGEGDCLLNSVTYRNNSIVPSTNNCHTSCKCISSIVKCDPIICSPPPEYMNDCELLYDSPDACCPTYLCNTKEATPPQPHNQMSDTEDNKKNVAASECNTSDCIIQPSKTTPDCSGNKCTNSDQLCDKESGCLETDVNAPLCEGKTCTENPEISSTKETLTSAQNIPVTECKDQSECGILVNTDIQGECSDENCKRKQHEEVDSKPLECLDSECIQHEKVIPSLLPVTEPPASDLFTAKTTTAEIDPDKKIDQELKPTEVYIPTNEVTLKEFVTQEPIALTTLKESVTEISVTEKIVTGEPAPNVEETKGPESVTEMFNEINTQTIDIQTKTKPTEAYGTEYGNTETEQKMETGTEKVLSTDTSQVTKLFDHDDNKLHTLNTMTEIYHETAEAYETTTEKLYVDEHTQSSSDKPIISSVSSKIQESTSTNPPISQLYEKQPYITTTVSGSDTTVTERLSHDTTAPNFKDDATTSETFEVESSITSTSSPIHENKSDNELVPEINQINPFENDKTSTLVSNESTEHDEKVTEYPNKDTIKPHEITETEYELHTLHPDLLLTTTLTFENTDKIDTNDVRPTTEINMRVSESTATTQTTYEVENESETTDKTMTSNKDLETHSFTELELMSTESPQILITVKEDKEINEEKLHEDPESSYHTSYEPVTNYIEETTKTYSSILSESPIYTESEERVTSEQIDVVQPHTESNEIVRDQQKSTVTTEYIILSETPQDDTEKSPVEEDTIPITEKDESIDVEIKEAVISSTSEKSAINEEEFDKEVTKTSITEPNSYTDSPESYLTIIDKDETITEQNEVHTKLPHLDFTDKKISDGDVTSNLKDKLTTPNTLFTIESQPETTPYQTELNNKLDTTVSPIVENTMTDDTPSTEKTLSVTEEQLFTNSPQEADKAQTEIDITEKKEEHPVFEGTTLKITSGDTETELITTEQSPLNNEEITTVPSITKTSEKSHDEDTVPGTETHTSDIETEIHEITTETPSKTTQLAYHPSSSQQDTTTLTEELHTLDKDVTTVNPETTTQEEKEDVPKILDGEEQDIKTSQISIKEDVTTKATDLTNTTPEIDRTEPSILIDIKEHENDKFSEKPYSHVTEASNEKQDYNTEPTLIIPKEEHADKNQSPGIEEVTESEPNINNLITMTPDLYSTVKEEIITKEPPRESSETETKSPELYTTFSDITSIELENTNLPQSDNKPTSIVTTIPSEDESTDIKMTTTIVTESQTGEVLRERTTMKSFDLELESVEDTSTDETPINKDQDENIKKTTHQLYSTITPVMETTEYYVENLKPLGEKDSNTDKSIPDVTLIDTETEIITTEDATQKQYSEITTILPDQHRTDNIYQADVSTEYSIQSEKDDSKLTSQEEMKTESPYIQSQNYSTVSYKPTEQEGIIETIFQDNKDNAPTQETIIQNEINPTQSEYEVGINTDKQTATTEVGPELITTESSMIKDTSNINLPESIVTDKTTNDMIDKETETHGIPSVTTEKHDNFNEQSTSLHTTAAQIETTTLVSLVSEYNDISTVKSITEIEPQTSAKPVIVFGETSALPDVTEEDQNYTAELSNVITTASNDDKIVTEVDQITSTQPTNIIQGEIVTKEPELSTNKFDDISTTSISEKTVTEESVIQSHSEDPDSQIAQEVSGLEVTQTTVKHILPEVSEPTKESTEPENKYSETTPYLIELEEHTHQIKDDITSGTSTEDESTTVHYVSHSTERGDQVMSDNVNENSNDNQTEQNFTEYKPDTTPTEEHTFEAHKTTYNEEEILTTLSSNTMRDQESTTRYTTVMEEETKLTVSSSTVKPIEEYIHTTASYVTEKSTSPATETEIFTEKEIPKDAERTENPIPEKVSSDEESVTSTSLSLTTKTTEEITTQSAELDKVSKPEEKPAGTYFTPETPKPELNEPPTDDLQTPDFPPSGAGGYGQEPDYGEEDQSFGPGTCRYGGKVYVSAQQIPRDDPCDFCFCFRSDIICLQQSCPPPIHGCHEEPIQGFCCPRYECPVSMATAVNVTTTTTTTTTTLPPHFLPHAYKGAAHRRGCQIKGHTYKVGEVVRASSGPCLHCTCGGDGQMKCDPKVCTPEPMLRQMIAAAVSAKRRR